MTENPLQQAMTLALTVEGEVERALAIGEVLEKLLRSAGLRQDNLGPITAALLLLWRGDHSSPERMERARQRAVAALKTADLDVNRLTMLATCGRLLLQSALELQGEVLLAKPPEYVPQEGDLATWLGKHVVKVFSVDVAELWEGTGKVENITTVMVVTPDRKKFPASPKDLVLYHREPADHDEVESTPS